MKSRLNLLRDEAKEKFLNLLGEEKYTLEQWFSGIEEELSILKSVVGDKDRFDHKVYDLLFILFSIAAEYEIDLDAQWENGWVKKQKYL